MRKLLISVFVVACTIETQIEMIRPGAQYSITSGDYRGIVWTDKNQTKPTQAEIDQAALDCKAITDTRFTATDRAKTDFKNVTKTPDERLNALVDYLGL